MEYPRKIYAIRHNATDRVYIGSSCKVDERLKQHITALRGHRHIVEDMQADFDKYGEDYTFTILDKISNSQERSKEYEWMVKYKSHIRGTGYNYKDNKKFGVYSAFKKPSSNLEKLLMLINESNNPEQAVITVANIISNYLNSNQPTNTSIS